MANLIQNISGAIKNWWVPMAVGVLLVAVGIYSFTVPDATYTSLAFIFALSFIAIGIGEIYFAFSNSKTLKGWGWYLAGGVLLLMIGGALLVNPEVTDIVMLYFVAFMLLFRSIQGLGISFEMKNEGILDWGNLAIASVLGILFSFVLLIYPMFNAAMLITLTGMAFIVVGIIAIVVGYYLHRIKSAPNRLSKGLQKKIEDINKEIQNEVKGFKNQLKESVDDITSGLKEAGDKVKKDIDNA